MSDTPTPKKRYRRVVTGHDANGHSVVLIDGESPHSFLLEKAGNLQLTELWETTSAPAQNFGIRDAADHERRIEPVGAGTVFRIIEYPPDRIRFQTMEPEEFYPSMGVRAPEDPWRRHPGMHKTDTVDYCIVLSGEIYAVLDEMEVLLRAGDCLIQRGTSHAWSNRSDEPCVIAFVLVAAHPVP
jgi:mannose-6-phosphate isomerase-like protein (cupin superfamily)